MFNAKARRCSVSRTLVSTRFNFTLTIVWSCFNFTVGYHLLLRLALAPPVPHLARAALSAAVIGAALPVAIWAKARKSHLLSGASIAGMNE